MTSSVEPPQWVGREAERAALTGRLDQSAAGVPVVALVVGDAGIGKSTLLTAAVGGRDAAVGGRDALVVAASGDEAETELDFGIVAQLLAGAPPPTGSWDLAASADPLEVGAALLRVVGELPSGRPVIITIDDAHLADIASLTALTFAARRLRAEPVALVLTCRTEGVARLPAGLTRLVDRAGVWIHLDGLEVGEVATLAEASLGRPVTPPLATRLRHHTGGNPLHLLALLDELGSEPIDGERPLPVPRSYAALVLAKVAACSPAAEQLLVGLSVLGMQAPVVDAAAVGSVDDPLAATDEAVATSGLVALTQRPEGRVLAFRHALARAAVYDDLAADRRARLHRAAATVTADEESLRHRIAAATGSDPTLAAEAAARAEALADRGAHSAAASLRLGAAGVAAGPGDRADHLLAAANHLLIAGRPVDELLPAVTAAPESATRSFVLGRVALNAGRFDEATRWLERAAGQAEAEPTGGLIAGQVAETLAVIAVGRLRQEEAIAWSRRALTAPGSATAATILCNAYGIDGSFATAEHEMDERLTERLPTQASLDARTGRGVVRLWRNDLDGARDDLERVRAAGIEHGAFHTHVNAGAFLAEVLLRLGLLTAAVETAEATAALTDDADAVWLGPLPHCEASFALAAQGELAQARSHAEVATAMAEALTLAPGRLWSDIAWLRIAHASDDLDGVVAIGDRMTAAGWGRIPEPIHHWRALYVEGLVAVGRLDDAASTVAELEAEAIRRADPPTATEACRARGVLEAGRDRRAAAEEAFARGLAIDAEDARPLERARLELAAGSARRRWGERRAAASALEAARERLADTGARGLLARVERELDACGLRPAKRSTAPHVPALTPQELTVARLVAAGRTNREAAAELVISAKTVEHHLTRIYAKLGVRSRTELTRVLLGGDPALADAPSPRSVTARR